MRRKPMFPLRGGAMILCVLLCLTGCFKDRISQTYTYAITSPVYALKSAVLADINGDPGQSFDSAGKIFVLGTTIFLNEVNKGIHIIDNSDPEHPTPIAFLNIPGNEDIAVKGNTLYADMYTDLLAIDISNPRQAKITGLVPNLFPDEGYLNGYYVDSNTVITGWITRDTTVPVTSGGAINPGGCANCGLPLQASGPLAYSSASSTTGVAGSMAKMALINDELYVIKEGHTLGIVDVQNAAQPFLDATLDAGFDLETIYPFRDKLFLGSAEGVYIYDISNPGKPVEQGQFTHGRACDPVITDGKYAYITLHAGTSCLGDANELDVVNVENLQQPVLVNSYPMTKPQGLSKDGNLLFVCDGNSGVQVFDATDPANLHVLAQIGNTTGYDVISGSGRLLVVATQGLYQYNYSNLNHIPLLSWLPVK